MTKRLTIALDFNGVLNSNPTLFRLLIKSLDADFEVLSISNYNIKEQVKQLGFHDIPVYTLPMKGYAKMSRQKFDLCEMTNADILIDDMKEVVDYINKHSTNTRAIKWH